NGAAGPIPRVEAANETLRRVRIGDEPTALTAAGKRLWVTVLPSLASHRGGTLKVLGAWNPYDTADPADFSGFRQWQMLSLTNDGLVTYRRVDGLAGDQLVPDLATTLPTLTDDRKTYTFLVRRHLRCSNGELVRPEDFRRGIERVFAVGNPYIQSFYAGIRGARHCARHPMACDLRRGISTDHRAYTVTFHLT